MNLSGFSDSKTARTSEVCAQQRAQNLRSCGTRSVLELCTGPSLRGLENAYREVGIRCFGNDIDPRWKTAYPHGEWVLGDALTVKIPEDVDTVMFAPPLSHACSGKREDSLSIFEVRPSYTEFILRELPENIHVVGLCLPGRSFSTREDRTDFFYLLSEIRKIPGYSSLYWSPLSNGCTKYVDVYVSRQG
jgi:hypothetical protein